MEPDAALEEAVPHPAAAAGSDAMDRTLSAKQAKQETAGGQLPTEIAVKFYVTGVGPSYLSPWKVQGQSKWTVRPMLVPAPAPASHVLLGHLLQGTGFVLPDRRIMTNAHVVNNATVVQVQKQDIPKKYRARVQCIAHDLDLALVSVEDEAFWEGMPAGAFVQDFPELYSEVKAVGFPSGGATVCVTKGVLSRIDAVSVPPSSPPVSCPILATGGALSHRLALRGQQLYVHARSEYVPPGTRNSPGSVLIYQIDAAINPGNSGGPTFDAAGKILGVSSSGMPGKQNVGYIIPATIAQMFLSEVQETGGWSGVSELGIECRRLECDAMRDYLSMGDETGVLVEAVAPLGALHGVIKPGDVVTGIDEHEVSNEGKVCSTLGSQPPTRRLFVHNEALGTGSHRGLGAEGLYPL